MLLLICIANYEEVQKSGRRRDKIFGTHLFPMLASFINVLPSSLLYRVLCYWLHTYYSNLPRIYYPPTAPTNLLSPLCTYSPVNILGTMAIDNNTITNTRKYHEKEEFVTGHSGTSPHEILVLCLVIPIGLQLYYKLHHYVSTSTSNSSRKHSIIMKICQSDVIIEFITLIVPMLLVQTSLFRPMFLLLGMQMIKLLLALLIPQSTFNTKQTTSKSSQYNNNKQRPVFLTIHRSCVYILTTIAILAVDFNIFPRTFCKTEVSGYGWMDLGAASFIIIAGWASVFSSSSKYNRQTATSTSMLAKKAIMKCTPLLLIGLIRLATNKGLEYQEHVSEYGVHWNFFFTLCCVEGFMVVWKGLKRNLTSTNNNLPVDFILALIMMIPYQIYLSYGGGQDFIENGERRCNNDSFICNAYVANREGILGVVGYLSLRLLSEDLGRICLLPRMGDSTKQRNGKQMVQRRLFVASLMLWIAHLCLTLGLQIPTSRRSTNASFILWSLAHNMSLLCMIHYIMLRTEEFNGSSSGQHTPKILEAVNRYGLVVFLSSNIITGLVNLFLDTLHSSDGKAMLILSIYLTAVCGIALLLDRGRNKSRPRVE